MYNVDLKIMFTLLTYNCRHTDVTARLYVRAEGLCGAQMKKEFIKCHNYDPGC